MNRAPMTVEPVTLLGSVVRLEPMRPEHAGPLTEVGLDQEIWRWGIEPIRTAEEMRAYVETALEGAAAGTALPFVILEQTTGRVIGSTRFGNLDRTNRRLEIGWTWLGRPWQRTAANTEAKYLLLSYAFETLGCIRVEFKTDSFNQASRQALLRIGAREEGIFRNHMITASGRIRHSVYFSIIEEEWPAVKRGLEAKLTGRSSPGPEAGTPSAPTTPKI